MTRHRQRGITLVDALFATALVGAAAVPLLTNITSGLHSSSSRRTHLAVSNLAIDFLERLAVRPVGPDPLRHAVGDRLELGTTELFDWSARLFGYLPGQLARTIEAVEPVLLIERKTIALSPDQEKSEGMEIWKVTARWLDDDRILSRKFARVTAGG